MIRAGLAKIRQKGSRTLPHTLSRLLTDSAHKKKNGTDSILPPYLHGKHFVITICMQFLAPYTNLLLQCNLDMWSGREEDFSFQYRIDSCEWKDGCPNTNGVRFTPQVPIPLPSNAEVDCVCIISSPALVSISISASSGNPV